MFLTYFPTISPILFACIVIFLGFVTPGYSHINYTISRLAIEQYGWIQSLNFFQLALACSMLGTKISANLTKSSSRAAIRIIFSLTSFFLIVAGIFPTDKIDDVPLRFSIYTPLGLIHAGSVLLFLAASPFGIHRLVTIFSSETQYKQFSAMTRLIGYAVFAASIVWLLCFALGIGLEYRGITQKMIIGTILIWMTVMGIASHK